MYTDNSFSSDNWSVTNSGNYALWLGGELPEATVFERNQTWRILINTDLGGQVIAEDFDSAESAIERANEILGGAEHKFIRSGRIVQETQWAELKQKHNGSPTYGRVTWSGDSISVKKSKSGSWFYVRYRGANSQTPVGWFDTAETARAAADKADREISPPPVI